MNKAFELILERLEATKDIAQDDSVAELVSTRIWNKALHKAKKIVQEVAEEYNDGWIPISERLPNVSRCRVTVKYDMEVGEPMYDTLDADFEKYQGGYKFKDSWMNDITDNVTAWQPRSEPYRE